jgi:hypothetical protein
MARILGIAPEAGQARTRQVGIVLEGEEHPPREGIGLQEEERLWKEGMVQLGERRLWGGIGLQQAVEPRWVVGRILGCRMELRRQECLGRQ